ncbi:hypothetical protein SLEP1_g55868 [Rubroshorea leprosula]|uniref:RING-type domain-containing protein n=1 Tax=Rubroshorea leprosula TaxID=152421 RepID=A0AAV5MGN3_9ROSI|nr:hypothetical protein SLEP1_g55868 [Rubroshorea leprosula]
MDVGESSFAKSKSSSEIWAKLVSLDSRYEDVEISSKEVVIKSETKSSSQEKHEWCKITRNPDQFSATMQNKSSNLILVDEVVVQSEDVVDIKCGAEVIAGPNKEGYLNYKFKVMCSQESIKQKLKISIDIEHAKCSICLNIWHDVVTIAPCLHSFCNGCFSEWLKRSQKKQRGVLCPQCRAVVRFAGRNHFLHNIEEGLLQADPLLRRSDEEVAVLNSYATIKSNLVIRSGERQNRKRAHFSMDARSDSEDGNVDIDGEESDDAGPHCPQCGTEIGGFRCNPNTIHLQCQACGGMMPSRADINIAQHCLGCDRAFCGAYWQSQRLARSDIQLVCSQETFKPIAERTISRIPVQAHEMNQHEQDITDRCIRQAGRTLKDVIADWIRKLNNREIDRTRLQLNHAEMISAGTHLCNWKNAIISVFLNIPSPSKCSLVELSSVPTANTIALMLSQVHDRFIIFFDNDI